MPATAGRGKSGIGDASFWLGKYADVYRSWTGTTIFPGSLNIAVSQEFDWNDPLITPHRRTHSLIPHGGNRDIFLVPCRISANERAGIDGFAWATTNAAQDPDYKVLEIIASTRLRDTLELTNGSIVTIEIPIEWPG